MPSDYSYPPAEGETLVRYVADANVAPWPGGVITSEATTGTAVSGRRFYAPMLLDHPMRLTGFTAWVSSGVSGIFGRATLYTADDVWQPIAVVQDSAEFDLSSSGSVQQTGLSVELNPGRYLMSFITSGQVNMTAGTVQVPGTYGPLPDNASSWRDVWLGSDTYGPAGAPVPWVSSTTLSLPSGIRTLAYPLLEAL